MDKIVEVKGAALVTGQHPGLPPQQIPLWESGNNVLFEDQAVKPAPGQSSLFTQIDASRVTGIQSLYVFSAGLVTPGLIWGTGTKLFRGISPPTVVDVSRLVGGPYTGGDSDLWDIQQFGQAVLATNGKDKVQYLAPGGANFVDIDTVSDLPATFRCRSLLVNEAYVLAFSTDNDPTEVRWCDEDNPLIWTPAPANSARDLQLRDLMSQIAAVSDFAEGIIVIGRKQSNFVRFIGAPFFFGQEHLITGAACISKKAAIAFDRVAYGFGPDGIWETDGSTVREISTPSVQKHIYEDTYDRNRAEETICWSDPDNNEIFWSYPTVDGLGETISYNRALRVWAMHKYWRTAATNGGPWLFPVVASANGGIFGQGAAGQGVSVNAANPIGIDDNLVITTGYGEPGYDGLAYGGSTGIL